MASQKSKKNIAKVNAYFKNKTGLCALQEAVTNLLNIPAYQAHEMNEPQCKKALKGVYINIFDYVAKKFNQQKKNVWLLKKRCEVRGFYPLKKAKSEGLKVLLKHFQSL